MRAIDRNAMALGISAEILMENAGRALAECIRDKIREIRENSAAHAADSASAAGTPPKILVLCGGGNNGGDGFVCARILALAESDAAAKVSVIYPKSAAERYTPESRKNLDRILEIQSIGVYAAETDADVRELSRLFDEATLIADCILGTGAGAGRKLREPLNRMVESANTSAAFVVSADTPTPYMRSDFTAAFHREKIIASTASDAPFSPGNIRVCDIGIPAAAELFTGPGDIAVIPKKENAAHKSAGGRVLIIGGCQEYQGAPYLAALAALRAGADIVQVATFTPPASEFSMQYPDLIVENLPYDPDIGGYLSPIHEERLKQLIGLADSVVIGCGLGTRSHETVRRLAAYAKKAVIDADALRLPLPLPLPQSIPCGPTFSREVIFTPHLGEFRRISGTEINAAADSKSTKSTTEALCERATAARDFIAAVNKAANAADAAGELNAVILRKGAVDVISDGESVRFNRTGTPAMTKGGTGDLLAGLCGALLCRMPAFDAASAAAYILGKCGEAVAEKYGDGLLASDLLPEIARVMKESE
ncbi:MAG: NAD(P)H-hydrate dehydratase [Methanomicrobium sp.]|nr:NAD(P)H-hydrate dehydratase [Methanomicrobium sp.]